MGKNNNVELQDNYIVLSLPTETVEAMIIAKVYHDGELIDVKKTLNIQDVRDAFNDAKENYFPPDEMWFLNDKALEELDG